MPLVKVTVREIDMATVAAFRAQLAPLDSSDGPVEIDFSEVTFIDSTGINALTAAAQTVRNMGQTFAVINASHHVERVLALIGLDDLYDPPAQLARYGLPPGQTLQRRG